MYTDSQSWAVGALQKAHLLDDKVRLSAIAGYASLNLNFFGIGSVLANRDASIPIRQQGHAVLLKGLTEVTPGLFLGARYRLLSLRTTLRSSDTPLFPDLSLPDAELTNVTPGIGFVAEYDTRDNEFYPQRGTFANVNTNVPRQALGSSFDYWQLDVAYNRYLPLTHSSVLALRGSACMTGGSVPFYDLCLFGMNHDLRGYETGKFRDETMVAVQAEYRWRFLTRLGLVAFAGVGNVAPSVDALAEGKLLPSVGAGLRVLASKKFNVNVSADFAVGRDSTGVYVYVGEAF
jgi:outer membrane protein assembly factor BamA